MTTNEIKLVSYFQRENIILCNVIWLSLLESTHITVYVAEFPNTEYIF